jgi:hypothetical protein
MARPRVGKRQVATHSRSHNLTHSVFITNRATRITSGCIAVQGTEILSHRKGASGSRPAALRGSQRSGSVVQRTATRTTARHDRPLANKENGTTGRPQWHDRPPALARQATTIGTTGRPHWHDRPPNKCISKQAKHNSGVSPQRNATPQHKLRNDQAVGYCVCGYRSRNNNS